jgi:hypothetical protein
VKREFLKFIAQQKWYAKGLPVIMDSSKKKYFIKNGFFPSSSLFFDFSTYGFADYLNDRDYKKLYPLNPPSISALIDNKAYVPLLFQAHPEWLPKFSAYLRNEELIFFKGLENAPRDLTEFCRKAIEQYGKLIVKPTGDGGGRKIFTVNADNLEEKIGRILSGEVILSSYMENEPFLKEIYPYSLNTIRVVFFKTSKWKNKILMIAHRFGTSISKEVDNVSSGGIGYSVNKQTGVLCKPYCYQIPSHPEQFDKHMDTRVQLRGFQIPDWPSRLKEIQKIVDYLDFVHYAGLDLAFTTEGIKIIEINSHPESIVTQLDFPALLDKEFKEFVVKRGYIGITNA